jgi:hypothetical protein
MWTPPEVQSYPRYCLGFRKGQFVYVLHIWVNTHYTQLDTRQILYCSHIPWNYSLAQKCAVSIEYNSGNILSKFPFERFSCLRQIYLKTYLFLHKVLHYSLLCGGRHWITDTNFVMNNAVINDIQFGIKICGLSTFCSCCTFPIGTYLKLNPPVAANLDFR